MHRKRIFTAVIALLFCASPEARTDQSTSSSLRAGPTTIDIRAFPIEGQTEGLEPQIFDFRYAPRRWQACIGLPDDPHKSIIGSDGGLYYDYGAGSFYGFATRILASLETQEPKSDIAQSILNPRIPVVVTEQSLGGLTLHQQAWAAAPNADTVAEWAPHRVDYLWLKMVNKGDQPQTGRIVLQVDSADPLAIDNAKTRLFQTHNPERTFCAISPPCSSFDDRALDVMTPSQVPGPIRLFFEQKRLAPREEYRALLTFHMGNLASVTTAEAQAQRELDRAVKYWQNADLPYDRITVPDPAVQALLDSCIRNIYQARELRQGQPAFQVGPTCYRGTWAADGPFILESITYLGRAAETRAGLELQIDKDEGPQGVQFSKKAGLRLWMIWRHAQLTGDLKWLEKTWPKVEQNVNNIIEYRQAAREDPKQANFGLMPPGFGDGGLGGVHREYTNVYWTLAGLRAAIEMAQKINKPTLSKLRAEYEDYWQAFDEARNRDKLTDAAGNLYVPVTMKGEQPQLPQRGAWAFLQSIFPGRIFEPDDNLMAGTMAMLDANQQEGLIFGTGWMADGIWNYAASFYAHAHLWLGHSQKAASTLYAFANHACPLLCWREEQNLKGQKENYVGDMPHNWASAEFIRLVRHLLIIERADELHILGALPTAWTKPGNKIQLLEIPTSFGPVSLTLQVARTGKSALIQITPPRREPPKKIKLHLEHFRKPVKRTRTELKNGTFITNVDFE
ncbi:MAG TPA: hypothetical protein VJJ98_13060 [Sedimentisphaerales bacterium]|nr:hypothetical protein [Sedimentisphaerales bacterium]